MRTPVKPIVLVHGGAGNIPDEMVAAYLAGVRAALDAGWAILEGGGSAVDAVEAAIVVMEDDGSFDAGRGSVLNRDGRVQLDAMIMDGASLAAGGSERRDHPQPDPGRAGGDGARHGLLRRFRCDRFAAEHGFDPIDNAVLVTPRERRRFEEAALGRRPRRSVADAAAVGDAGHDTVRAVVLDAGGGLAAGTSTGGSPTSPPPSRRFLDHRVRLLRRQRDGRRVVHRRRRGDHAWSGQVGGRSGRRRAWRHRPRRRPRSNGSRIGWMATVA
jgi:beta-aspartyl-peptidase (threonine type)